MTDLAHEPGGAEALFTGRMGTASAARCVTAAERRIARPIAPTPSNARFRYAPGSSSAFAYSGVGANTTW